MPATGKTGGQDFYGDTLDVQTANVNNLNVGGTATHLGPIVAPSVTVVGPNSPNTPIAASGFAYLQNGLDGRTVLKDIPALGRNWPGVAGIPTLMTVAPPTVTLSAANAATSVAGSAARAISIGGVFQPKLVTLSGGPVLNDPINNRISSSWTEETSGYITYGWLTDSPKFEVLTWGKASSYRLLVDGQAVSLAYQALGPADGNLYRLLVDFTGVRAVRQFTLEMSNGGQSVSALQMLVTDTLVAAPRRGQRVIIIGDSFTEGTGATIFGVGFSATLGYLTGWDVWSLGEGGTGYLQPNGGASPPRTKAAGHLSDVTNNAPDLIIWALGINDSGFSAAAIQAEATIDYATIQAALPGVPQIVLGPFWGAASGGPLLSAGWTGARDGISAAAAVAGLPFADPMGTGYLYGTGHVGATTGVGPSDFLVCAADTTHPSPAGHDALARVCMATIAAVLRG